MATLRTYIANAPAGELSRLHRRTGVSYTWLCATANDTYRFGSYKKAKLVSDATGGAVSIAELCEFQAQESVKTKKRTPTRKRVVR